MMQDQEELSHYHYDIEKQRNAVWGKYYKMLYVYKSVTYVLYCFRYKKKKHFRTSNKIIGIFKWLLITYSYHNYDSIEGGGDWEVRDRAPMSHNIQLIIYGILMIIPL